MFNLSFTPEILYFLSRVVAFLHLLYVLFVFLGLFAIYIGYLFKLKFVHNIYFRVIHLLAMVIVAIQQYFMINCPLTILEKKLLQLAGKPTYSGAFVEISWININ
jgi:cytochrome c biogenesis protein CcdA